MTAFAAPIAAQIWDMKYRLKEADGTPVDITVEDTWRRIARALAAVEKDPAQWEDRFYGALADFRYLPAGRITAGAGTGRSVTLFNCFVMGTIPDSMSGIFDALKEAALTMQQGGGIGYDFSTIRPRGAAVHGVAADASGPLSFMDVWDAMCRTIMSAGSRRGALMATMRTMGYLGLLLSAGVLFGFVLTYYRVPQQFTELFLAWELGPYMVLAIVIAFYIVLGMFLEPVSMTFITLPTIFPLMQAAGFDMIWFGIVYTITMEIAVLTPPVGLNLYVIQGISRGTIAIGEVSHGCLPFIASMVVLIALLIALPETATWLPATLK